VMHRALTTDQVIEAAADLLAGTVSIAQLARRYAVSRTTLKAALLCQGAYTEMADYLPVPRVAEMVRYRTHAGANKLTPYEAARLRVRYFAGERPGILSRRFGISRGQVYRLVRGRSYRGAGGPVYNPQGARG